MKKVIKFIKNNILGFLVGLSLCLNGVVIAENIITANQVTYNDSTVQTELDSLFDAVDINERLGNTDEISSIGDGTVSGAIKELDNKSTLYAIQDSLTKENILIPNYMEYEEIIIKSYFYSGWCNTMHIYPKYEQIISNGLGVNYMLSSSSTYKNTTFAYSYFSLNVANGELEASNAFYINGTDTNDDYFLGYKVFARK